MVGGGGGRDLGEGRYGVRSVLDLENPRFSKSSANELEGRTNVEGSTSSFSKSTSADNSINVNPCSPTEQATTCPAIAEQEATAPAAARLNSSPSVNLSSTVVSAGKSSAICPFASFSATRGPESVSKVIWVASEWWEEKSTTAEASVACPQSLTSWRAVSVRLQGAAGTHDRGREPSQRVVRSSLSRILQGDQDRRLAKVELSSERMKQCRVLPARVVGCEDHDGSGVASEGLCSERVDGRERQRSHLREEVGGRESREDGGCKAADSVVSLMRLLFPALTHFLSDQG